MIQESALVNDRYQSTIVGQFVQALPKPSFLSRQRQLMIGTRNFIFQQHQMFLEISRIDESDVVSPQFSLSRNMPGGGNA